MIGQLELVWRLALATFLGGLIGLERESHRRPAGFRTHILVCVGSALVMILSIYAFRGIEGISRDPARLAAQVVSGIGFLGAGTIMREGATVKGLTTAASLWVVAGIGLAVGSGFYFAAAFTSILVITVLYFLDRFERRVIYSKRDALFVEAEDKPGTLGAVASVLGKHGVDIKGVDLECIEEEHQALIQLSLEMPFRVRKETLLNDIAQLEGVRKVSYEEAR